MHEPLEQHRLEPTAAFLAALEQALAARTFVRLAFGKARKPQPGAELPPEQASARLVDIKGEPQLSFLLRHKTKDITRNAPLTRAGETVRELLQTAFLNAHLFTTEADLDLRTNNKGEPRLYRNKPSLREAKVETHNRQKQYVLEASKAPYLAALGITSASGHLKGDKADKYRQLQNIINLVDQSAADAALRETSALRVVDMGSGKAYLSFALYDYFNHHLKIPTEVLGIDHNPTLVDGSNALASELGYAGLRFECATVEASEIGAVDLLLALHACDTATDAALFKGISAGAAVIMAVPCCQKELRPQFRAPADEQALLKHDTFKDRYAQMLTDGLRALLLESQGYRAKVIEFISDAHTHRNVMLVAVHDQHFRQQSIRLEEAQALMARYHIGHQNLASLLGAAGRLGA
jgi:hypothetical protein